MTTLITLVGEQPIPNLLPIRHIKPERVLFVHTGSGARGTKPVACHIARLVPEYNPDFVEVDPYDLLNARAQIAAKLSPDESITVNITGGTKMMALAAYALAVERNASFIYLQTEGKTSQRNESLLFYYHFEQSSPQLSKQEILPTLISARDYLLAHLPDYREKGFSQDKNGLSEGGRFEKAIYAALQHMANERNIDLELLPGIHPTEVSDTLDIDLVVRSGNQVGVVEIKKGPNKGKHAIDQLTTIARREYLGTYTARFVVLGGSVLPDHKLLFENSKISVAEIKDYHDGQPLSADSCTCLWNTLATQIPLVSLPESP
ncbi:MAG: DUF1887 family CARF protein [Anaerolineae bacterium]|jgi:hypothetical protein|nr:DUF1887 family CARF protein [Anaerolineae bacterium]